MTSPSSWNNSDSSLVIQIVQANDKRELNETESIPWEFKVALQLFFKSSLVDSPSLPTWS